MTQAVVQPFELPEGGTIGAFTPSDEITESRRHRIERNVAMLESHGHSVVFSKNAYRTTSRLRFLANERLSDITELIADQRCDALIATCGGKISNFLIQKLNYGSIASARKPIIGFSDVCVILNAITSQTGLITFYGPNVLSKLDETEYGSLVQLRADGSTDAVRSSFHAVTIVPGFVEGRLFGGNLSTFTISVAGTVYEPKFDSAILFWEAGARDWRLVSQYIAALKIRGVLQRISGMIIGKIGDRFDLTHDECDYLLQLFGPLRIPILYLPIFGHGRAPNPIWPIGGLGRLDATQRNVIICEQFVEKNR